jgi:hypothetical protein
LFLGSFTMFSSLKVWSMNSPIYYEFGKIRKWTTPCTARVSSRISPHTILRTTIGTLTAPEIVPCHLKFCLEKTMNSISKKSLLALGV